MGCSQAVGHPDAFFPFVNGGLYSTGIKRTGFEADHSPPSSTEVCNGCTCYRCASLGSSVC